MKKYVFLLFSCIEVIAFGQDIRVQHIESEVQSIDADSKLELTEFDWVELTGITTDGGGVIKIWKNEEGIKKIIQEIGFSYGRVRTTLYMSEGKPIKIIETEENFELTDNGLNYKKLKEVFKEEVFVFDWKMLDGKIKQSGKRVMSEGSCSSFDYEPIMELAEKAISK